METKKLLAVYPHETKGSNEEIRKKVRDWYYSQACENEEELRTSYVDILTKEEKDSRL
jgi:hypothetical protein